MEFFNFIGNNFTNIALIISAIVMVWKASPEKKEKIIKHINKKITKAQKKQLKEVEKMKTNDETVKMLEREKNKYVSS